MKRTAIAATALSLAVITATAACSSDSGDTKPAASSNSNAPVTLTVFAAASLKKGFTEIADTYMKAHPGVTIKLSFDGSSTLVTQIKQGASVDVIATADQKNMTNLGDQAVGPKTFTKNVLTIATAPGNPKKITDFRGLNMPGVTTVVCAIPVPCGNATEEVEKNTGVTLKPASQETSVTAVLTKVTSGQADAGVVYGSDAKAAGAKVTSVDDPAFAAVVNNYPIATVKGSSHTAQGDDFIKSVLSPQGQQVLTKLGFTAN